MDKNIIIIIICFKKFRRKKKMSCYIKTQGLYYNPQFGVDKVKQEIYTIRNL
jgi:hypothetical protein